MTRAAAWLCFFLILGGSFATASEKATVVVVLANGDDGLTQRLAEAIKHGLKSSPDFVLRQGDQQTKLIVRIPTNVEWKQSGKRTKVLYTVEFATGGDRVISTTSGNCFDDQLRNCSAQVVKAARSATKTLAQ